jgi:hypothetical protein
MRMKKLIVLLMLGLFAGRAAHAAEEGVVHKVGDNIKKGGEAAAHGIEKGVGATERGVKKAVDATKKGVKKAATATEKGVKKGAAATGEGLQKAGHWIEEKADPGEKK